MEYRREANNTRLVFHRNDAFADSLSKSVSNPSAVSDKRPIMSEWDRLSANEKRVYGFMRENGSVKTAQIADLLGTTQRRSLLIVRKLVDLGIAESHGFNRNRTYSLKK